MNRTTSHVIRICIFMALCVGTPSCTTLYFKILGIKEFKPVTKDEIKGFHQEAGILNQDILELDSTRYRLLIQKSLKDTTYYKSPDWWIQNHIQPTQVMIYNTYSQKQIAGYFNCIAESRPIGNLTYNKYNELEFFPPLTYSNEKWIDSLISYQDILATVHDLSNNKPFEGNPTDKKYLVLILYSLATKKQSINIINETRKYMNQCLKDSSTTFYINMDNYFYGQTK